MCSLFKFKFDKIVIRFLLKRICSNLGRDKKGKILVRHKKQGAKKLYRIIDLRRMIGSSVGVLVDICYDPNRKAFFGFGRFCKNRFIFIYFIARWFKNWKCN